MRITPLLLVFALAAAALAAPESKPRATPEAERKTRHKPLAHEAATTPAAQARPADAGPGAAGDVSFKNDIMPLFGSLGCNAARCHGATGGKGGFRLSMFGADPEQDYLALTRADEGRRINVVEPMKSLVLLKPTAAIEHGGKRRMEPDSPEYQKFAAWLARGAPRDSEDVPAIVSIAVAPEALKLEKGKTQRLTATAEFSDGSKKDVTASALYDSLDPAVATAAKGGLVEAKDFGQAHVLVSFNRRSAVARIAVPQPLPEPFPKAAVHNKIDEIVLARLQELGIPPSELCTDQEFLRRVYLDVIGKLPTPDEVRAFLADKDPEKRSKLIEDLFQRSEFADFWALKWGDLLRIKAEYPSNLWPNAVQAYHAWVRDAIARNKPYDEFARELIVSSGCNFRDPPCNFYRAMKKRDPQGFAETTALVFMGARLGCASCHGHPTESWTIDDNLGMAAFFPQIKFKSTKEWKEEIVYLDPSQTLRDPRTREEIPPKILGGPVVEVPPGADPRVKLAQWLTDPENPWFARNFVNRAWYWLLGRGIVHEPDDIRPTNPPSNPELLAYLERELVGHDYDMRHIYRLILNSATYQRSSQPTPRNAKDEKFFSHHAIRRLTAEQLSDAIGEVTQVWDKFSSRIPEPYSYWPEGFRAVQMADGSVSTPFLELFGRPPRDTAFESDRNCETSMRQALFLITSSDLESKVARSPRIREWLKEGAEDEAIVEELFLLTLSRTPTPEERQRALEHLSKEKNRTQAVQDLMWAVLNTKEFLFNH